MASESVSLFDAIIDLLSVIKEADQTDRVNESEVLEMAFGILGISQK